MKIDPTHQLWSTNKQIVVNPGEALCSKTTKDGEKAMTMFTKNDIVYNKSGLTKESQVANALAQVSTHVLNIKGSKRQNIDNTKISDRLQKTDAKIKCAVRKLQKLDGQDAHIEELQEGISCTVTLDKDTKM